MISFPSEEFKLMALSKSHLSDANKAYAKLCDICVDVEGLYGFAKIVTMSFRIQAIHYYKYGPNLPKQISHSSLVMLELCKQTFRNLLEIQFPDDADLELIALHKFCIDALNHIETYKIYE